jgi:two-component system KDP operon response regulator KdpE
MEKILIVEDEPEVRQLLVAAIETNGFAALEASDLKTAIEICESDSPALITLDLELPDGNGIDLIEKVRKKSNLPIIVLSGRQAEEFKITTLDAGADDYVTKPFSVKELLARIRTNLRVQNYNSEELADAEIACGALTVNLRERIAYLSGKPLELTKRQFDLLCFLARFPDTVLDYKQILEHVWGPAYVEETQYVRVYIGKIRKQLADAGGHDVEIETRQGIGYILRSAGA